MTDCCPPVVCRGRTCPEIWAQHVYIEDNPSCCWDIYEAHGRIENILGLLRTPWTYAYLGHTPSTAGTFRKKFRKNSGKTPETLSERFLEFPSRVRLGWPKPYNSRHLRLPERFQNSLPPSTAGDASFFQNWFRRGPLRAGHGIPAVLGVFLSISTTGNPWKVHCYVE